MVLFFLEEDFLKILIFQNFWEIVIKFQLDQIFEVSYSVGKYNFGFEQRYLFFFLKKSRVIFRFGDFLRCVVIFWDFRLLYVWWVCGRQMTGDEESFFTVCTLFLDFQKWMFLGGFLWLGFFVWFWGCESQIVSVFFFVLQERKLRFSGKLFLIFKSYFCYFLGFDVSQFVMFV